MTKSFTHILFIWLPAIFFSLHSLCQVPAIEWQRCYGGNGIDGANCIQPTKDGGYIIAGYTSSSNSGDVGDTHGGEDCWIVKIDGKGNIQWQKSYGGSGLFDVAKCIQVTADGGYIMAGYTRSNDGDVSGLHNSSGTSDCWIVKIDSAGNIQWQKCYGGSQEDVANSIQVTPDGGYIMAGYTYSNDGDVSGFHISNDNYYYGDCWIVKLDNSGNIQWQKCYGGSKGESAFSIQVTPDHGYIVAGSSNSNDGDVTGNHDGGGCDYWIFKLDSTGNIQWQKCYGGSLNEYAYSIQITPDHGYIVAGEAFSNDGDVGGNHVSYTGGLPNFDDCWLIKLDSVGNLQWQRCLGGSGADMANSIQITQDGGYIVAGTSESNDGNVTGNHGGRDFWVVKLDNMGVIQWQKSLGGSGDDEAFSIQPTVNGGYIVAGYTRSNDGDVSGNHDLPIMPLGDVWVVKLTGPCYVQFNLSASSNNICPGTPVTFTAAITSGGNTPSWSWTVNGTTIISGAVSNTYTSSFLHDSDRVVCSLSNGPGCTPVKDTIVMAVDRIPSVSITSDTSVTCSGSAVHFTAYPVLEGANPVYQWQINGLAAGTNSTVFSTAGLQNGDRVSCNMITNGNRCAPTVTSNGIPISVITPAISSVTVSTDATAVCSGTSAVFTATAVNGGAHPSFQWQVNGVDTGSNQNTFTTDSLKNGDVVNCTLTSDLQCAVPVVSNSITLAVYPVPVVTCGPDTVLASGNGARITATVTGATGTYQWSPAIGLDNPSSPSPFATPAQTTTYLLEVTTARGCTAGCQVIVTIQKKISIPNAFSPNGDGINDVWAIPSLADFHDCTVDVFDRSGQPVFHSTGYNHSWDGTCQGKPIPWGTYYYIINPKNGFPQLSGSITILR